MHYHTVIRSVNLTLIGGNLRGVDGIEYIVEWCSESLRSHSAKIRLKARNSMGELMIKLKTVGIFD